MNRISIQEITKYIGQRVKVAGWVNSRRDHGKIIFIDLRDRSGLLQLVFTPYHPAIAGATGQAPSKHEDVYSLAQKLRPEWVIEVEGKIAERPESMKNPNVETGNVELQAESLIILSEAKTPPFEISGAKEEVGEDVRLKYRYLDLRREKMQKNLDLRHKVIQFARNFLSERGFIEIETPILTKSTPEGARDFVVPSRLHPGKFYALPQSPQQYKQLLMVSGFEKYFQIARCFRDEDPRADRQAEFTQLDIEMSFVEQEEILNITENLYTEIVKNICPEKKISQTPFPRLTYKEAMQRYNSDKPDLRKDPIGVRQGGPYGASKNDPNELAFCFITDFPMFEWSQTEKRWDAVHHPFTKIKNEKCKMQNDPEGVVSRPYGASNQKLKIDCESQEEFIQYIKENPKELLAHQYDFVLNGYEIGGGSIREHNPRILETVFEIMGNKKETIREQFGHLLEAFEYGVPPHGGIAPGIDRFVMILANEPSIREVMAFPKTGDGRDLMMDSPSEITEQQIKELRIKFGK